MSLKQKLVSGTFWSLLGSIAILVITLSTNLILVRLLSPSEFGQFSVVLFFIVIGSVISRGGLAGALIRKKVASKLDYSTVFVFNLVISILYLLLLIIIGPSISRFYEDPELKLILPFLGLSIVINGLHLVNIASLTREMKFKEKNIYHFFAVFIASIVGIFMAYKGYGVWSLVAIQLITAILLTLIFWVWDGFIVSFKFSKKSFSELYAFGINTSLTSLITTGFDNIYSLVIAKYFTMGQVGFYYQAKKLQEVPVNLLNTIAQSVVFSSLAKLQDNIANFFMAYFKIIVSITVFMGVFVILVFTFSEQIVLLLFGVEWLQSHIFLQLLVIASFFFIQEQFNRVIFKVFNKTQKLVWLEIIKKLIQIISIIIGVYYNSITILLYGLIAVSLISYLVNLYVSRKVIKVSIYKELIVSVKVIISSASIITLCYWLKTFFSINGLSNIFLFLAAIILYIFFMRLFKLDYIFIEAIKLLKLIKRQNV